MSFLNNGSTDLFSTDRFFRHLKTVGDTLSDHDTNHFSLSLSPPFTTPKVPVRRLPAELEREIFLWTMSIHRESAFRLVLVAKRVQIWYADPFSKGSPFHLDLTRIEHIIYRVVRLEDMTTINLFLRTVQSRPPTFFANYVKSLSITNYRDPPINSEILWVCTGLEHLADWVSTSASRAWLLRHRRVNSLRFLSVYLWPFTVTNDPRLPARDVFGESFFSQITHLHVLDPEGWLRFNGFGVMPRLTHLSFINKTSGGMPPHGAEKIQIILSTCKSLLVLAFLVHYTSGPPSAKVNDPRVVVLLIKPEDRAKDWEATSLGKRNIWTEAEELVAKQTLSM
jgi:hypothetical protein